MNFRIAMQYIANVVFNRGEEDQFLFVENQEVHFHSIICGNNHCPKCTGTL